MELKLDEALEMARLHRRQKRYAEAKGILENICKAAPDNAEALFELGKVARDLGKTDIAVNMMLQSVQKDDTNADVYVELSGLYAELEDRDGTISAANLALALRPGDPWALTNKGRALLNGTQILEAVAVFRELVRRRPKDSLSHFELGRALMEHGQFEQAALAYRRSLQLNPNQPGALGNLAWVYIEMGKRPRAVSMFRQALKQRPHMVRAHLGLALIKKIEPGDPRFENMRRTLAEGYLGDHERCYVLFALARAHDQVGEFETAFDYCRQANEIRGKETPNDRPYWDRWMERIMTADSRMAPGLTADANKGPVPVFVVGLPRSGKTLMESLISHSPQVLDGREKGFFRLAIVESAAEGDLSKFPECVPEFDRAQLTKIGRLYFEKFAEFMRGKETHLVNTSPLNYQYVGMILRCLPNAKIVYCARGELDHALYLYFKRFEAPHPYSYGLDDALHHIALVRRMMEHWIDTYGSDRILSIQYEDLVADPTTVLHTITDHIGIERLPAKVTKGIHADEVGHWRNYAGHFSEIADPGIKEQVSEYRNQAFEHRTASAV